MAAVVALGGMRGGRPRMVRNHEKKRLVTQSVVKVKNLDERDAFGVKAVVAGLLALVLFVGVSVNVLHKQQRRLEMQQMLYNQWGIHDHNEHWGGVGSENYHTAKWDNTGSNQDYHPRDGTSATADAMEPKWWRPGPGANSEYTGHDMDGELFNPPDEKIFKPFYMKSVGKASTQQLFDVDGPSPRDPPRSSWARAGKGTTSWMLKHEGPLLASSQEKHESPHPLKDVTAMQVQVGPCLPCAL
ncbi:hypothetical protein GUITHDRAFT_112075 [Guillardia theta CCMP2712]|uniref:Uncharacterized protein n=1 Tax=Guillardia theta (strain CCMP2712) TaxID=905079 RepID=L1J1C0_GUITC|nr:hypothetical protein GUITHDRAFT_112075 [Guillardia theta CCMP2712]EKX41939.1 hypothetical protein GUITHDRAFT_112075 [Guillardia theta CCMP2712]|eukprot:XP_005828919.1 hypothetical protein GUITHDRAFT_112075 [Guillardia theta CCMP2712]